MLFGRHYCRSSAKQRASSKRKRRAISRSAPREFVARTPLLNPADIGSLNAHASAPTFPRGQAVAVALYGALTQQDGGVVIAGSPAENSSDEEAGVRDGSPDDLDDDAVVSFPDDEQINAEHISAKGAEAMLMVRFFQKLV